MITLDELVEKIKRHEPNHVSLIDYEEVTIFDSYGFRSGTFTDLSSERLQLNWGLVWIDWHVPRVEIHELRTRDSVERYLVQERSPFINLSCGGFYVVHEDLIIDCELVCETTSGDCCVFDPEAEMRGIDLGKTRRILLRWKQVSTGGD